MASFPVFGYSLYTRKCICMYIKFMFIYICTHLALGEITTRYKSLLLLCVAVVRGQFVGVASCAQQGSYMWRHKFKLIGNQFQMKRCEALSDTRVVQIYLNCSEVWFNPSNLCRQGHWRASLKTPCKCFAQQTWCPSSPRPFQSWDTMGCAQTPLPANVALGMQCCSVHLCKVVESWNGW